MRMECVYGKISVLKGRNAFERVRSQIADNIHWLMDDEVTMDALRDYYHRYSNCGFSLEMASASESMSRSIVERRRTIDYQTYEALGHASNRLKGVTSDMNLISGIHRELDAIVEDRTTGHQEVLRLTRVIQELVVLLEGSIGLLDSPSVNPGFADCVGRLHAGMALKDIAGWMTGFTESRSLEIKEREILSRRMDMLEVYKNLYKENESLLVGYASFKHLASVTDHSDADIESTIPLAFHIYEGIVELENLLSEMTENAISPVILESIDLIRDSEDIGLVARRLETVISQVRCHDETDGVILRIESWMKEQSHLMNTFPGVRTNLMEMFYERNPGILELEMQIETYQEEMLRMKALIDRLPAHVTQIDLNKLLEFINRDMAILDLKESRFKLEELLSQEMQLQSNPAYMRRAMAIKLAHEKNRRH